MDRNQLKTQGVRFGRSLQMLFKTIGMFSAEHSAAQGPLQMSFNLLNELVKQTRSFTIGFVDQRLMINNILTTEKALNSLENEFLKRGIGAITFEVGITLAAYKRALNALARPAKEIEEAGGLAKHLEHTTLEFVRVFPASKNQMRTESGDTVLDMDSESFLMAKAFAELQTPGSGLQSLDQFIQSTGIQVGGGGGAGGQGGGPGGGGPGGGGGGMGTGPGSPSELLGSSGTGVGYGAPRPGEVPGGGLGPGPGGGGGVPGSGLGPGLGPGPGGGGPGGGGGGGGTGFGSMGGGGDSYAPQPAPGGPADIERMVEGFFTGTLLDPREGPQRSYVELAKVIKEMRPEFVLQNFPAKRREELRALPPDQMAAEIIEDTAVKWAMERLVTAPSGQEAVIVEEEVVRVLLRSLQTTQMADRLAKKLAEFVKQYNIPPTTYKRIQDELSWVTIPMKEKTNRLLNTERYDTPTYRRLMEHLKELIKQGDHDSATALGNQYLAVLDGTADPPVEEMSRIPELLRAMGGVRTDFWQRSSDRLLKALRRPSESEFFHVQVVNALLVLSKTAALYEDFDIVHKIGHAVEDVTKHDTSRPHDECCRRALTELLSAHAVDRVIEIFLQKKDDVPWSRTAAALLRWSDTPAITKVFQQLEDEPAASNRLALLRLIGRIGPGALALARAQLNSDRWYVVRNGCKLLGELKDPELLERLAPVLKHPDPRVQKAAVVALMDSRKKERARIFADALPHLDLQILDDVLTDILFLKDPACLFALERFIFDHEHGKTKMLVQAVQALAAIPNEETPAALARVIADKELEKGVRRVAFQALNRTDSARAQEVAQSLPPDDPLHAEAKRAAKAGD